MWKKVIAVTALVSLLWIAAGGATTYYINQVDDAHNTVMRENVTTIQACGAMLELLWKLEAHVIDASQRGQWDSRHEVAQYEAEFEQELKEAERTAYIPDEFPLLKTLRREFAIYREQIDRRLRADMNAPDDPQTTATVEETMVLAHNVADPCKKVLELNEAAMRESNSWLSQWGAAMNWLRITLLIVGPAVGIFCGFSVARSLHRSISQISVTLRDATGDLEEEVGHVDVSPSGDLPALRQQVQLVSTRIKHVMDELQQARRNASRSERLAAVGQLAAGVAHGLRNPLTSVKLLIQIAAQKQVDRRLGEKQLQVVQEEIARMEGTIQGLLDLAGPPKLRRVQHDLRETVRRALNLVEGKSLQQHVMLVEGFSGEPMIVDGDPEQLHQVFINLLLNGIESMSEGGELRVTVERSQSVADCCDVVFADSGEGIPTAKLDKIFEPFVTSKERGTGLGLPISRRIVLEHGGMLTAANRPDGGAVFTVRLPLRLAPQRSELDASDVRGDEVTVASALPAFDSETLHA